MLPRDRHKVCLYRLRQVMVQVLSRTVGRRGRATSRGAVAGHRSGVGAQAAGGDPGVFNALLERARGIVHCVSPVG